MKTTLGGPPTTVKTALEGTLEKLEARKTEVETAKTQAEQRDLVDEATRATQFRWGDLLPQRWGQPWNRTQNYTAELERLTTARSADVEKARAELRQLASVTEPFRKLAEELRGLSSGVDAAQLGTDVAKAQETKLGAALETIDALRTALAAAGECEATKQFSMGQLTALEAALKQDRETLKEVLTPKQEHRMPMLERAVEQFVAAQPPRVVVTPQVVTPPVVKPQPQVVTPPPVAKVVEPERIKVADKQGPLTHRGSPVEFGAEKETNMKNMSAGDKLQHTYVLNYDRSLLPNPSSDMLTDAARGKAADQVTWTDLNDKGKSAYCLAYSARHTQDPSKPKWPVIKVSPNKDYSNLDFEPNGWIEVISEKFSTIRDAHVFLDKFGWGHIHTTWMRGAPVETQKQIGTWMRNANLWMFIDALENRGASANGENFWRFAIKGLSIPTEEHIRLALELIGGRNMTASAFSKHLHIGMRASGKYGSRDRVGFESRGGNEEQKKRVIDSLLNGLCQNQWGSVPEQFGSGAFKLVSVGQNTNQVKNLPTEFRTLVSRHLQEHPTGDLKPADADRIFSLVANATFYAGRTPNARLNAFDQRACTPLLNFEALPWLTDAEKQRAISARGKFIEALSALDKRRAAENIPNHQLGQMITDVLIEWSRNAKLSEPFGRWLDGGERQHFMS